MVLHVRRRKPCVDQSTGTLPLQTERPLSRTKAVYQENGRALSHPALHLWHLRDIYRDRLPPEDEFLEEDPELPEDEPEFLEDDPEFRLLLLLFEEFRFDC